MFAVLISMLRPRARWRERREWPRTSWRENWPEDCDDFPEDSPEDWHEELDRLYIEDTPDVAPADPLSDWVHV